MSHNYKQALGNLTKDERVCFLYLERLIIDNNKKVYESIKPPKIDNSIIENKIKGHDKSIKNLNKKFKVISEMKGEIQKDIDYIVYCYKNMTEVFECIVKLIEKLKETNENTWAFDSFKNELKPLMIKSKNRTEYLYKELGKSKYVITDKDSLKNGGRPK